MNAHAGGDPPRRPRREPALAMLLLDGHYRSVCLGCSAILNEIGMLDVVKEMPFSERQPEFSTVIYAIAEGYTLGDCQEQIAWRHTGTPWGT